MEISKEYPIHYRYFNSYDENGNAFIFEQKFYPVRETECCYFVVSEWVWNLHLKGLDISKHKQKKVVKNSVRSYCYPSKETALNSFKIRKEHQLSHCRHNAAVAERITKQLVGVKSFDELSLGGGAGKLRLPR